MNFASYIDKYYIQREATEKKAYLFVKKHEQVFFISGLNFFVVLQ